MMKPRPIFPVYSVSGLSNTAFATLQCRRIGHVRAIAPALSCHIWHDGSRSALQGRIDGKIWEPQRRLYASTAATPAKKTRYDSATTPYSSTTPPPPAKRSGTNIPAKTSPSNTTSPARQTSLSKTSQAVSPSPRPTTATILQAKENLNPPPFTYAPEITVPARKTGQGLFSWLWNAGRAYVGFYKQGITHVRQTLKLAKALRQKAAKTPDTDISQVLTRAEWQIVTRSRIDALRLPAFATLVLLLGEWLPLVVVYITPLIPEACRIPQQVQRTLRKLEDKRQDRMRRVRLDARRLMSKDAQPAGAPIPDLTSSENVRSPRPTGLDWRQMTLYQLSILSAQCNCYPAVFDWLPFTPPKWLLQRNFRKKMEYLRTDDGLIERDGGWAGLGRQELERACVERGVRVLGKKEHELRGALAKFWAK
ncbi:hypothetical protein BDW02DRAFT_565526 [Decorospora gaudefroyi]|uniref:Letm1 RBD domain-containing protein n=1 Tax=Decorospora gaudefroyi TaxID=184978 RepID=A0A6A5KLS7_9PLEO|nr:hypothetical protein BDW02DRAFT_565526 [Decorospora gaudefroyi]